MNNAEVFQLFDMEKGLTYFTAALRTNGIVLDRLLRLRKSGNLKHLLPLFEGATQQDNPPPWSAAW